MENDRIIEKINTALNILEGVRTEILKADSQERKKAKKSKGADPLKEVEKPLEVMSDLNQQLTIKQTLEKYGQPSDGEYVESIQKIITGNAITLEQLDACLDRVKWANDKEPKNNIKAYTFSCLHKINKS